jgi:hypothetical protein
MCTGTPSTPELERRNVEIERAAAQLERDRADFKKPQGGYADGVTSFGLPVGRRT